jgi:hypothetical protein
MHKKVIALMICLLGVGVGLRAMESGAVVHDDLWHVIDDALHEMRTREQQTLAKMALLQTLKNEKSQKDINIKTAHDSQSEENETN